MPDLDGTVRKPDIVVTLEPQPAKGSFVGHVALLFLASWNQGTLARARGCFRDFLSCQSLVWFVSIRRRLPDSRISGTQTLSEEPMDIPKLRPLLESGGLEMQLSSIRSS